MKPYATYPSTAGWIAAATTVLALLASPLRAQEIPFGVYDPEGRFADSTEVEIEHVFLPWHDVFLPSLYEADSYALERGRALLVTIEPWTWLRDERNTPQYLINGIKTGLYDSTMRSICEILGTLESPVTVRWGQEMDDESGQFIWANWEPSIYIYSYRRMVDVCRSVAPALNFMWSPIGSPRMAEYYPGDDYVDLVGISVFGFQPWERDILGRDLTLEDILREKYPRAAVFGKPVVVAELGFVGSADYVEMWSRAVESPHPEFPGLVGLVYFNQPEVYPWPDGYGLPDWRLSRRVIE